MRRLALIIPIAAWAVGCGDQPPPPAPVPVAQATEIAPMACQNGWSWNAGQNRFIADERERAVVAGPITLFGLNSNGDGSFRRARSIYTKVLLEPHATTTVAVAGQDRGWVRLATAPPNDPHAAAGGDSGIRFEGCAPRTDDSRDGEELGTGYAIAVMVDRPGCATFEITPEGGETIRRRVRFGVTRCA